LAIDEIEENFKYEDDIEEYDKETENGEF